MSDLLAALSVALEKLWHLDPELLRIVALSLRVSLSAVLLAALVGMPLGALLAVQRFPLRGAVNVVVDSLLGLPPVVVGLAVYLLLSRSGPLGALGLLFTPHAMILAQFILVLPIVTALTRQSVAEIWEECGEQLVSLGAGRLRATLTILWDGRFRLLTALLAGFGRAIAEVGAVLIVGGNIDRVTRVMTTSIALETSKGDLPLALGLGVVLLLLALAVNLIAHGAKAVALRLAGSPA
jgi:tungstate transport system permease protein